MYVKPRAGALVRDPETMKPVPAKGRDVPRSSYWLRRLQAGELEQAQKPKRRQAGASKKED
nr:DUF2635 domain-containing protein [Fodinicurvata fenggangensis]